MAAAAAKAAGTGAAAGARGTCCIQLQALQGFMKPWSWEKLLSHKLSCTECVGCIFALSASGTALDGLCGLKGRVPAWLGAWACLQSPVWRGVIELRNSRTKPYTKPLLNVRGRTKLNIDTISIFVLANV